MRRTIRFALGPNAHDVADDDVGALALLISQHFRHRTEPVPTFSDDALGWITAPLMAVVGGKDAMLDSYETERRLTANVRDASVHLLPESGHLLPDQTEGVLLFLCSPAARND
jgi:pimeloyl-ACP methyl ester carboxylesterase